LASTEVVEAGLTAAEAAAEDDDLAVVGWPRTAREGPEKATRGGGEWEPIKITHSNLAYIPNLKIRHALSLEKNGQVLSLGQNGQVLTLGKTGQVLSPGKN
jgi:hypothetical protein